MVEVDINVTTTTKSIATLCSAHGQNLKQKGERQWKAEWKAEKIGKDFHLLAPSPAKIIVHVQGGICKGYSALTTEMRTGKIGVSCFLHTRKVLEFNDGIRL